MKTPARKQLVSILAVPLFCLIPFTTFPQNSDRNSLMPKNFNFMVYISDTSQFMENMKVSPFGKLLQDPQFKDFLGNPDYSNFLRSIMQGQTKSDEIAALNSDNLKLLQDEFLLAVVTDSVSSNSIRFLAAVSKDDYEQSLTFDKRIAELKTTKTSFLTEEFSGVEITQTVEHTGESKITYWQAHYNNTAIGSHNRNWLEKTITALKDREMKQPDTKPVLEIRVSLNYLALQANQAIKSAMAAKTPDTAESSIPSSDFGAAILQAIGLESSGELAMTIIPGKTSLEQNFAVKSRPGSKGIWAIFGPAKPVSQQKFPFIPDNLYSWQTESLNLFELWNSIPEIITAINPEFASYHTLVTNMIKNSLGLDPGTDILAHLDSSYTAFAQIDNSTEKSLLYWNLKDERALTESVAKLFSDQSPLRASSGVQIDDFRGYNIYSFKQQNPETPGIGFSIINGTLAVGEISLVRSAVRSVASGKFSDAGFQESEIYSRVQKTVPSDARSYGFTDWPVLLKEHLDETVEKTLRNIQQNIAGKDAETDPTAGFLKRLDVEKIPDAEHLASFFGPSIHFSRISDKGLEYKTIFSYPAQQK